MEHRLLGRSADVNQKVGIGYHRFVGQHVYPAGMLTYIGYDSSLDSSATR